ncbi:MAG: 50S ribosomal protein L10 [Nitrospiraceae bacterium]|nr:50S ribosomal protein L10 [Nitrospiraceae bacterium]
MPKQEKIDAVAELKDRIQNNTIAIATQYKGINVAQATELRSKLRAGQVTFKVYKNTLVRRALDELDLLDAAAFMDGPTAWAFCKDPVTPARILKDFTKEAKAIILNGGVLEGKVVSKEQIEVLASLPTREVLLAQLVGTIAAPLRNFVGTLNAVPRNFVNVLDQIKKQKEEEGAAA